MDYYEEFGMRSTASPDEVHQAYKAVTRLLHPDGQMDAKLKLLAECQMKRANEIFGVLMDPRRRLAYDQRLDRALVPSAQPRQWTESGPWMRLALRHWFWILIAAIIFGSGLWYVQADGSAVTDGAPVSGPDGFPAADAVSFAGNWAYSPRGKAQQDDPDRPRDVELRLEETGGAFQGSYREWYSRPRGAASPGLVFRVKGRSHGGRQATLDWMSDDGSQGEMDLVMLTPDSLRSTWWATRLGRGAELSSGAALLIRQPSP